MSQQSYWNSAATVASYSRPAFLYAPELRLLGLLKDRWAQLDMLDIGIGAGRTTAYFAELTRRYVGIDYAPNMVEQCKARFAGRWPHAQFEVGDATQLTAYGDASFHLVMFSYNGIDCVDFEARAAVLREMRRVCRPGGWMIFSSHNFHSIPKHLRFNFTPSPRALRTEWQRYRMMRRCNAELDNVMQKDRTLFVDGTANDSRYGYVKPDVQADELSALGFKQVRLFSCLDGNEITGTREFENERMSWVYYFCAA
jgi:SAM-dependent methyltransferase